MSAPRLNRKLVLETPVRTPDGAGGFAETWTALGTLWAQVSTRSGTERMGEAVQVSRTRLAILVRAAPFGAPSRPRADQRFREGIRIFNIRSVAESDPDARYLICQVDEEVVT